MEAPSLLEIGRGLSVGAAAVIIYSLPTIIAVRKKKRNRVIIGLVNYFLGWTIAGWIFALMWARAPEVDKASESV